MKTLPEMQCQRFVHTDMRSHAPQGQSWPEWTPKIEVKQCWCWASLSAPLIIVKAERTYCFTAVRNQTGRLLEGFLQVMLESLVFVLFGAQLHEFTCKRSSQNINNSSALWSEYHKCEVIYLAQGLLWLVTVLKRL